MERFRAQVKEQGLAPHPNRVELSGAPGALSWPDLCPACGAPASEKLEVRKVFTRQSRSSRGRGRHWVIPTARIPYCAACADRHRAERPPLSPLGYVGTMLRSGYVLTLIACVVLGTILMRGLLGGLDGEPIPEFVLMLMAFFAFMIVASIFAMWRDTERLRVPAQTDVTLSCDYSDDLAGPFQTQRRIWAVRDPSFFEAFRNANRERL